MKNELGKKIMIEFVALRKKPHDYFRDNKD